MNNKKSKNLSSRSMTLAFKSFAMDASERELDEALISAGLSPDALVARVNAAIGSALKPNKASNRPAIGRDAAETQVRLALHQGLGALVRLLRRQKGLSERELADAANVDADEIRQIECDPSYSPSPRTIYQLEEFFALPERTLVLISGAVSSRSPEFTEEVLRFAAHSKDIGKLSREEKRLLNNFVRFLVDEKKKRGQ